MYSRVSHELQNENVTRSRFDRMSHRLQNVSKLLPKNVELIFIRSKKWLYLGYMHKTLLKLYPSNQNIIQHFNLVSSTTELYLFRHHHVGEVEPTSGLPSFPD